MNITKDDNIYSSKEAAMASAQIIDGNSYVATTKINGRNKMAWVAVDKDGRECIYQFRPKRGNDQFRPKIRNNQFIPVYEYSMWMVLPKGSIKKLIGRDLSWEDNPVELK